MSDTKIAVNNMANAYDDLHSTKPNAEDFTDFENAKINNCFHKAMTEKLQPCKYYEPAGQKLPVSQNQKTLSCFVSTLDPCKRSG